MYSSLMDLIIGILTLGFLILIHEMGHLLVAKWSGVPVQEFAVGMGPKVFGKKVKDTTYNLRLLPVGGYVKLAGLDFEDKQVAEKDKFQNKPWLARFSTLAAGSFINILFGFVVFYLIFFFAGVATSTTVIKTVKDQSPAYYSGLKAGDKIVAINDIKISNPAKQIVSFIHSYDAQKPVDVTVSRLNEVSNTAQLKTIKVTPEFDDTHNVFLMGIELDQIQKKFKPLASYSYAIKTTLATVGLMVQSIEMLISGQASFKELSGPVGMIQVTSHQTKEGAVMFFQFVALISIALGFMNLLPIPVLDGGHILFLFIELILRRPVPRKVQLVLNNLFAIMLITFMIVVVFNDIKFWSDRSEMLNNLN